MLHLTYNCDFCYICCCAGTGYDDKKQRRAQVMRQLRSARLCFSKITKCGLLSIRGNQKNATFTFPKAENIKESKIVEIGRIRK